MESKKIIRIRRYSQTEWLARVLIIVPFLIGVLAGIAEPLYAARYLLDAVWVLLFVMMTARRRNVNLGYAKPLAYLTMLFAVYTAATYIVQFQSGLYYLWGFRNTFRCYVAFLAFAAFLKQRDIDDLLRLFDKLFWLNFVISVIQFYGFEVEQDLLGGIFGTQQGSNGYSNIFMVIVLSKSVIHYLTKRENTLSCFSKCAAAIFVAVISELKFFFVEFVLIILLAVIFTGFSWRKFLISAGALVAVFSGAALLTSLFPYFENWFTVEWFIDTAVSTSGYTGSGDLNRLTAISSINELWLKNWGLQIFGLGLGNCDTSSFAFLNTPFFRQYGDMHYSWISYAHMYLECGWIGLIFYFGFFAIVYLKIAAIEKKLRSDMRYYCQIARIFTILCIPISFYNASLRGECGYMAFFVLAIPFTLAKQHLNKEKYHYVQKTSEVTAAAGKSQF